MDIVLSGLDESACRRLIGDGSLSGGFVSWMDPDRFIDPSTWNVDELEGRRLVWFYRSPVIVAGEASQDAGQASENILTTWLSQNSAALNLRRLQGIKLLVINADKVSIPSLRSELGVAATGVDDAEEPAASHADEATLDVVSCLFGWGGGRFFDVFNALQASSWPPSDEVAFEHDLVPDEGRLFAMLDALGGGGFRKDNERLRLERQRLLAQLNSLQEDFERRFIERREFVAKEAIQTAKDAQQVALDAQSENELLLAQIEQVRSELHTHYLSNVELRTQLADEVRSHGVTTQDTRALRRQLLEMHKELQAMAQAHVEVHPPRGPVSRFARLLPRRVRLRRERAAAEGLLEQKLDMIRRSKWFDSAWYLSNYRDVESAGMDPVRHYFEFGWKEGRNPGMHFDTAYYLAANVDVAKTGLNPLLHFIEHGEKEGRSARDTLQAG